ncbi:MAG: hypothetical protein H7Y15_02640 [Pseudonocardia sp.]|nr:hypothetical protein [Pseudonocardia sp.]
MATATRNLTQAKATAAYRALLKQYKAHAVTAHPVVEQGAGPWPSDPVLCRNFESWSSTTRWAVVWEEGPYEWALDAAEHSEKFPVGVFVEPINGYALGLYLP